MRQGMTMKIIDVAGGGYTLEKDGVSFSLTLDEAYQFNQKFDADCEGSAIELEKEQRMEKIFRGGRTPAKLQKEQDTRKKIVSWINEGDVGCSSQTLLSVMMGIDCSPTIPYDRWDFGRCHRLLQLVDKDTQKACLKEAAQKYPIWVSFEREWERLTELYVKGEEEEFKKLIKSLGW